MTNIIVLSVQENMHHKHRLWQSREGKSGRTPQGGTKAKLVAARSPQGASLLLPVSVPNAHHSSKSFRHQTKQ